MPTEHLLFAEQTSDWESFETPDKAIPVSTFAPSMGLSYIDHRATGSGRALSRSWLTSKSPSGSLSMAGWQEYLGYFVKQALMHNYAATTPAGATTAKEHGFLPKDDTVPNGLSVQVLRNGNAQSFKGLLVNRITFNCAAGDILMLDMDWLARDEAPAGGLWFDDGTAGPAAETPAYFAAAIEAYRFHTAELYVGGTPTLDVPSKTYSIAGGTKYEGIERAEVALENNLDARLFWGSQVPRNVVGQDRAVTGSFDLDQSTINDAVYLMSRSNTRAALRLLFTGTIIETTIARELEIILPNVVFAEADLTDISGDYSRRIQSVSFRALADANGNDIAIRIVDSVTSY